MSTQEAKRIDLIMSWGVKLITGISAFACVALVNSIVDGQRLMQENIESLRKTEQANENRLIRVETNQANDEARYIELRNQLEEIRRTLNEQKYASH